MRHLTAVAVVGALLAGCTPPITIDPGDSTPPAVAISLISPESVEARYDDGTAVGSPLDPAHRFAVRPRTDGHTLSFVFFARDGQSGISMVHGTLRVRFTCTARVLFRNVSKPGGTVFSQSARVSPSPDGTTSVDRATGVNVTLEDLWSRGGCTEWGQVINVSSGTLSNIQVEYVGEATNNARPPMRPPLTTTVTGHFTIADAAVAL